MACLLFFLVTVVQGLRWMAVVGHTPPTVGTVSWTTGLCLALVGLTVSILLIHGLRTTNPLYFLFWLVWDSLVLTFNLFIFFADIADVFNQSEIQLGLHQFYLVFGNLTGLLFGSFAWLVVNSHRKAIKEELEAEALLA